MFTIFVHTFTKLRQAE